ncbi:MAG: hypothetical protein HYU54_01750 [Actinobacteria bacterium]|nr:hypothetical protein [Actinomycetota bacterium]
MDRTGRSPSAQLRRALAALFGLLYLISVGSFWVAGFVAYFRHFSGPARLLGLLFFPTLALPFVGRGTVAGIPADSFFWWGWFALHLALAGAAMLVYPRGANGPGGAPGPGPSAGPGEVPEVPDGPEPQAPAR